MNALADELPWSAPAGNGGRGLRGGDGGNLATAPVFMQMETAGVRGGRIICKGKVFGLAGAVGRLRALVKNASASPIRRGANMREGGLSYFERKMGTIGPVGVGEEGAAEVALNTGVTSDSSVYAFIRGGNSVALVRRASLGSASSLP